MWQNMFYTVNFFGYGGSETRAISAVDVALWDLLGQYTGQPIYNLLGGRCRESIWVYNTCVGHGKHQDYQRWASGHSGELATELLGQGVKAMKIWPFDQFGVPCGGPIGHAGRGRRGRAGWLPPDARRSQKGRGSTSRTSAARWATRSRSASKATPAGT